MSNSLRGSMTAVVLAAGMGTRLRGVEALEGTPKGLIVLGEEPIIARSLRLLREHGVTRTIIVVGYQKEAYCRFAKPFDGVELVENLGYATTGTMSSLACALERVDGDFLLLESDLVYERRALTALIDHPAANVILASGPTNAGDEVWLEAPSGRLLRMSKDRASLNTICGELVGIHRVSAALAKALHRSFVEFVVAQGHGRMSYETDAMVQVASTHPIEVHLVADLLWGEIDDDYHYRRVRNEVLPAITAREGQATA